MINYGRQFIDRFDKKAASEVRSFILYKLLEQGTHILKYEFPTIKYLLSCKSNHGHTVLNTSIPLYSDISYFCTNVLPHSKNSLSSPC